MDEEGPNSISPFFIAFAGFVSAAIILTIYQWITAGRCGQRQPPQPPPDSYQDGGETTSDVNLSAVQLIPAYKYSNKEVAPAVIGADKTCAVCLSEFKEGEDVRLLPECLHCFHVPCIDMWLSSHSSCPLCRTATLVAQSPGLAPSPHSGGLPNIGG
ncbi:RING-H2 finger protein ATL52-like [Aristolochia californica]|uniref:RING-H2 finger protein ATL52-like n=1 Tax=Aristolochia californica TaxID=171875 RepID=UPI0035E107F0